MEKTNSLWDEWVAFNGSNLDISYRTAYFEGALCVYKMIASASDSTEEIRKVMSGLAEEFRNQSRYV